VIVFASAERLTRNPAQKIEHLPPSAKLVFTILKNNPRITQKEIIGATYLPSRTVRYALARLKEENVITERFSFDDARQSLYALNAADVVAE